MKWFLDPMLYDEWEKLMGAAFMRTYFIRFSLVAGCR